MLARRDLASSFLPITSLQAQPFHAITHSFAQRRHAIPPILNSFRTLLPLTAISFFARLGFSRVTCQRTEGSDRFKTFRCSNGFAPSAPQQHLTVPGRIAIRIGASEKESIVAITKRNNRTRGHSRLKGTKIRSVQKLRRANTETNELVAQANDRFLRSGAQIKDIYGKLGE